MDYALINFKYRLNSHNRSRKKWPLLFFDMIIHKIHFFLLNFAKTKQKIVDICFNYNDQNWFVWKKAWN